MAITFLLISFLSWRSVLLNVLIVETMGAFLEVSYYESCAFYCIAFSSAVCSQTSLFLSVEL